MTSTFHPASTPAHSSNALWRVALGFVFIGAAFIFSAVITYFLQRDLGAQDNTPLALFLHLMSFSGAIVGVAGVTHILHKASLAPLFGPTARLFKDFVVAVLVWACIAAAVYWIGGMALPDTGHAPTRQWETSDWLIKVVPLAILGLLVQTFAEELVFRGYLQNHLTARFGTSWLCFVVPSILFGLAHYDPDSYGETLWPIIAYLSIWGFFLADLTQRSGGIGTAWGIHFANNFMAFALFSVDGNASSFAMFVWPHGADLRELLQAIPFWIARDLIVWVVLVKLWRR